MFYITNINFDRKGAVSTESSQSGAMGLQRLVSAGLDSDKVFNVYIHPNLFLNAFMLIFLMVSFASPNLVS